MDTRLHLIFDIDGTLVQSFDFDEAIYVKAIEEEIGFKIDRNWNNYRHVTDVGILNQVIEKYELEGQSNKIFRNVKETFISQIAEYVKANVVHPIAGAVEFLERLSKDRQITISFATGGWYESAVLKLDAAGFQYSKERVFSSNDHYKRTEIMKFAQSRVNMSQPLFCSYFGDGEWDKQACLELGMNFILVGKQTFHHQNIADFTNFEAVMSYIH